MTSGARPRSHWLPECAGLAAWTAVVAGGPAGIALGWKYLAAGFPRGLVFELARQINQILLAAVVYLAIYLGVSVVLNRTRIRHRAAHLIACGAACVPPFLVAAYQVNLHSEIAMGGLFTGRGLRVNGALAAALVAAYALLAWLTSEWTSTRLSRAKAPDRRWFAIPLAIVAVTNVLNTLPTVAARAPEARTNVILIVVDALRADHLSAYGYGRPTPQIDALARDGVLFEQAIGHGTITKTAVASLLTSRLPSQHGVYRGFRADQRGQARADALEQTETTLAEVLQSKGFLTAGWVRNTNLRPAWGFAQGFLMYEPNLRRVEDINRAFVDWTRHVGTAYPFFAYLHYLDLHAPYRPPPPYDRLFGVFHETYAKGGGDLWKAHLSRIGDDAARPLSSSVVEQLKALYDGQLKRVDDAIGRLVRTLKDQGLYDDSLIVFTSDHGEAFQEHGFVEHANVPYDELIRVPLIIKFPHSAHAGRRVPALVRHIDVMPTILETVKVSQPPGIMGCSVWSLLDGERHKPARSDCFAYAISEASGEMASQIFNTHQYLPRSISVRTAQAKYLFLDGRSHEFYDLLADPGERRNLIASTSEVKEALGRIGSRVAEERRETSERPLIDPQTLEQLRSLGYIK